MLEIRKTKARKCTLNQQLQICGPTTCYFFCRLFLSYWEFSPSYTEHQEKNFILFFRQIGSYNTKNPVLRGYVLNCACVSCTARDLEERDNTCVNCTARHLEERDSTCVSCTARDLRRVPFCQLQLLYCTQQKLWKASPRAAPAQTVFNSAHTRTSDHVSMWFWLVAVTGLLGRVGGLEQLMASLSHGKDN